MGFQSSDIIWDYEYVDAEAGMMQVTNWNNTFTYRSGNKVIYASSYSDTPKVYECIATESYDEEPIFSEESWRLLDGIKYIEIIHKPGTPSEYEQVVNSMRQVYKPGAYAIKKDGEDEFSEPRYGLYMCKILTNVYVEGFRTDKWMPVMYATGKQIRPKEHKDVYYDDGKNETKWHRMMYFWPDGDNTMDEEISNFSEEISYSKGEKALYSDDRLYADQSYKCYEYIDDYPSTPTLINNNVYPATVERRQNPPTYTEKWKCLDGIKYFDQTEDYAKGQEVIFNVYETGGGSGQTSQPVTIFDENRIYVKGQGCLRRIKPYENVDVDDEDAALFGASELHDFIIYFPDPDDPLYYKWGPNNYYAHAIVDNDEVYGLYNYISDTPKKMNAGFDRNDWQILIVRQYNKLEEMNRNAYVFSGDVIWEMQLHSLVIGTLDGVWCVFICQVQSATFGRYYTRPECGDGTDWTAVGWYHPIFKLEGKEFYYGKSIDPSLHNEYFDTYWKVLEQTQYEMSNCVKLFRANKNVSAGLFNRDDWNLVTQKKTGTDLYGKIWMKYSYVPRSGIPFGFEFITQYPYPLYSSSRGLRFNKLQLYRGNNILQIGTKAYPRQSGFYDSNFRYAARKIGQTTVVYAGVINKNIDFFLRKMFSNTYVYFTTVDNIDLTVEDEGVSNVGYNITKLGNGCGYTFWSNNIMSVYYPDMDRDWENSIICKKVTFIDIIEKTYYVERIAIDSFDLDFARLSHRGYTNRFFSGHYIIPGITLKHPTQSYSYSNFYTAILLPKMNCYENTCYTLPFYAYVNKDGEIYSRLYTDGILDLISTDNVRYYLLDSYKMIPDWDIVNPLIPYLRADLIYKEAEDVYFSYYEYSDGYDNNDYGAGRYFSTYTFMSTVVQSFLVLNNANNIVSDVSEVTEDHSYDGIVMSDSSHPEWGSHTISNTRTYVVSGYYPHGYSLLNRGVFTDYGIPQLPGGGPSINDSPFSGHFAFVSPDNSYLYEINYAYSYIARKLVEETPSNDVGFLSLVVLTKTHIETGIRQSADLVRNIDVGYYFEADAGSGIMRAAWATVCHYFIFARDDDIYGPGSTFLYRNNRYAYFLNYVRHTEIGNTIIPGYSTGIWTIDLDDNTAKCDYMIDNNVIRSWSRKAQMKAVFDLVCVQKIPYYGYQTCEFENSEKTVKYLNLFIANYTPTSTEEDEFYDELMEEWEEEKCITAKVNISDYQDVPLVSNVTGSVVGGVPMETGDIIVTTSVYIEVVPGRNERYELVVVLPCFKNTYLNAIKTISVGLGSYNPIVNGAFFWLTTDNIMYKAKPQYGGPENGAQGFSGW